MRPSSRRRESATTLASIAAVFALATGLSLTTVAYLDEQATRGIRAELDTRAGADLALRASIGEGSNPTRQDTQVRAAIAQTFARTHVPVEVTRTLSAHVTIRAVADPTETDRGGSAQSIPDFATQVEMIDGLPPAGQTDVAVQADAATELGLATGDEVLVAGVRFVVSGTWRPREFLDPRWYGDPMVETGFNEDHGPFVIDEDAWGRLDTNPTATWTIVPDVSKIDAANAGILIAQWGRIRDDWRPTVSGLESLSPQNRLVQTLRDVEARVDGLRAVEPVVFTLLAAVALVAVAVLLRLMVAGRRRVSELYWARGDSRRGLARRLVVDVGLAGFAGSAIGAILASAVVTAVWTVSALARVGIVGVVTTIALFAGALVLAVIAARPEASGGRDVIRSSRRRVRRAALPGVVILLVAAAALSVWQLRLYGSPLTPTAAGSGGVDPVAVIAPALALAALIMLVTVVFPRAAAFYERRTLRGRVTAQLAARGIGQRIGLLTAPLVLMALAAGSVTIAATYSATWSTAFAETAALRAGSDLHVNARVEGLPEGAQNLVAQVPGVTAVAPLELQPLLLGSDSGTIVAATPAAIEELATPVPGKLDPANAADAIAAEFPAPQLPPEASALTLDVQVNGFVAPPTLVARFSDALGVRAEAAMPFVSATGQPAGTQTYTYTSTALPAPTSGGWRVTALDWTFADQPFHSDPADLHLARMTARVGQQDQDVAVDQLWVTDSPELQVQPPVIDGTGAGFFLFDDTPVARMTPSLTGTGDDRPRPPILISQQLAATYDLAVGDSLALALQDAVERLNCVIAGIVPAVPGSPTESAVLLDLDVVQHFQLRTTATPAAPRDLWVTASDPAAAAEAIRAALPANTRIDSSLDPVGRQILGSASSALWVTAGCIVLLALIGVAASAAARLRAGRNDVAVLRSLGLTSREQTRVYRDELGIVLGAGLVSGLVAGCVVAALTIPYFARAAVTQPYLSISTPLGVDLPVGAGLIAVLIGGATTVLLVAGARVAALVKTAVPGEAVE